MSDSSSKIQPKEERQVASAGGVFKTYFRYTKAHPWLVAMVIFGMLLIQASNLVGPLYMRQFFNLLAAGPTHSDSYALIFTLVIVGVSWLVSWMGSRIQDTTTSYLEAAVRSTVVGDAFEYLIRH